MALIKDYVQNRSESDGELGAFRDAYNIISGNADSDINKAISLREKIEQISENLNDEDALEAKELFPTWAESTDYEVGNRIRFDGILYKCLQAHTSQNAWNPKDAVSLWTKVLIPDPEVIPEWEQPDSTNPYMKGDKVMYNGIVYESLIDNNIWSPEAYPSGWKEVI